MGNGEFYHAENSQGGHPGCWLWHALSSGDEGDAEGDAADCRQADDSIHRGGGVGEWNRGDSDHQRPCEAGNRGPL